MEIKIKKHQPDAKTPTYGSDGAACFDVYSLERATVQPGRAAHIETGLSFEVPTGHVLMAYSRSGHGFNYGVRLSNCVGVIDSDYRGTLKVALQNDGWRAYQVQAGERVAQCMVVPVDRVTFVEADELGDTERGTAGLGSTGR